METDLSKTEPSDNNAGSVKHVSPSDPLIGSIVANRFEISELIGAGGWSRVYKAQQLNLNRTVAIKILHSHLLFDSEKVARFQREAHSLSSLSHPSICSIFDFGVLSSGQPYMVMEYLEGESLSNILLHKDKLTLDEALPIFTSCCEGLIVAHDNGIIHRDIKPANIFVIDHGKSKAKLLDFGLAKITQSQSGHRDLTQTGDAVGTVQYMSPEQALGHKVDSRSDIYSFGCVMYEVLLGRKLFEGSTPYQVMSQHVSGTPRRFRKLNTNDTIRQDIEIVVFKAVAKEPENRYQSFEELKHDLEHISKSPAASRHLHASKNKKSRPWAAFISLVVCMTLLVIFMFYANGQTRKTSAIKTANKPIQARKGKGVEYHDTVDGDGNILKHATRFRDDGVIADDYAAQYDRSGKLLKELYDKYDTQGRLKESNETRYLKDVRELYGKEFKADGKPSKASITRYSSAGVMLSFMIKSYSDDNKLAHEFYRILDKTGKNAVKDIIKQYRADGSVSNEKVLNYNESNQGGFMSLETEYGPAGTVLWQKKNKHNAEGQVIESINIR